MNIPKPYAAAIAVIAAGLATLAYYYPAVAPIAIAAGGIAQAIIGDKAHQALPPGSKP